MSAKKTNSVPDPLSNEAVPFEDKGRNSKIAALLAVMFAAIFVSMTLDRLLSFFLPISFAILSVASCLSFAIIKNKWLYAPLAGLFFGLASFITAFLFGKTAFYNPLISVLPRIFVGLFGFAAYRGMLFLLKEMPRRRTANIIASAVGSIIGVLTNTLLVLLALQLFNDGDKLFVVFQAIAITNFLPELIIATVLVPPIVVGVRRGMGVDADGIPAEAE